MAKQQPRTPWGKTLDQGESGVEIVLRPKNLMPDLKPEYVIDRLPASIGRHPSNVIELPFESISRYHARLELKDDKLRLVDLSSANGTYVNGQRVQIVQVADQDSVSFGSLDFILVTEADRTPPPAPPPVAGETSVHFVMQDRSVETIYHAQLPDDTSHAGVRHDEITDTADLKRAKQQLSCFYRLHELLNTTNDEDKLLKGGLDLLFDVLPVDRGVVLLREDHDPTLFKPATIKIKLGGDPENIGISKTILRRCLRQKVAILSRDAPLDERFEGAESIVASKMRSVMCVPLINAKHIFGFIHLDTINAVRNFTKEDLAFLANVGVEIALHLHNLRMTRERIQSERLAAIGQTITGMAHNVKNILVLSQGGMQMMERRLKDKNYEALDEVWVVISRGLERINRLVQDMLDYSRARTVAKRKLNVNELIHQLHESLAEEMKRRAVECVLDIDEDCPALMLDGDGLEKSLMNLIVNALEACTEETGRICLRTRMSDEGNLVIEVEDNGSGIPIEVQPRIFVPFFTTKGSQGSGLGLAMTKKIIEDMGGQIEVKTSETNGTCFVISLMVEPEEPRLAEPENAPPPSDE